MKRRHSIFFSLMTSALVVISVILFAIVYFINHTIHHQAIAATEDNVRLVAANISLQVRGQLSGFMNTLTTAGIQICNVNFTDADSKTAVNKIVKDLLFTDFKVYNSWLILEKDVLIKDKRHTLSYINGDEGIYETFDLTDELLANTEESNWYHVPKNTRTWHITEVAPYDNKDGKGEIYVSSIAIPLIKDDVVIGVLGVDVLYHQLFSFIGDLHLTQESVFMLITAEGLVIYSPEPKYNAINVFTRGTPEIKKIADDLSERKSSFITTYSPYSDHVALIAVMPIAIANNAWKEMLYIYVDSPIEHLYGDAHQTLDLLNLIAISGVGLFIVVMFFAVRRFVLPIQRITEKARHIADGQLAVVFDKSDEDKRPNEISLLSSSLTQMLQQLNHGHQLQLAVTKSNHERERAEENVKMRTEFFAKMSHEIRTPLNAIIGFSQVLMRRKLERENEKMIGDIYDAANILLHIINDIIDMAKLEAQKFVLSIVDYDLHKLLDNVGAMIDTLARKKKLNFTIHRDECVPQYLHGDDIRLRQILLNLLGNAVKFTKTGKVELRVSADKNYLQFEIIDTGIGIRPEDLGNLFNAFKQVDLGKTRDAAGSGLGLAISESIIILMRGEISVNSEYGKGSTFTARIPMRLGDAAKIRTADNEDIFTSLNLSNAKILVVDDNTVNLKVAKQVLGLFNIKPVMVTSGEDSIKAVQQYDFDLIFMDHMMPGMDGIEALQAIRQLSATATTPELSNKYAKVPIVALTANAITGAKEMFLEKGFDDFLSKPIETAQLANILRKYLEK